MHFPGEEWTALSGLRVIAPDTHCHITDACGYSTLLHKSITVEVVFGYQCDSTFLYTHPLHVGHRGSIVVALIVRLIPSLLSLIVVVLHMRESERLHCAHSQRCGHCNALYREAIYTNVPRLNSLWLSFVYSYFDLFSHLQYYKCAIDVGACSVPLHAGIPALLWWHTIYRLRLQQPHVVLIHLWECCIALIALPRRHCISLNCEVFFNNKL